MATLSSLLGTTFGSQGPQGLQGVQGPGNQGLQGLAGSAQGTQGLQGTFGPATIPQNSQAAAYTLVAADNGQHILAGAGVTVPAGVFTTGQNVVIYNNTATTIGITTAAGGVILRLAGTSQTGNRFLTQRGLATVLCVASNEFAISGAGVT